ncbi:DUF1129 domain-containing protein [Lacticaseibacillus brantae]|uniref:Membrane-associated protein n=1 Tax=Lacticaseibacillus brantae DSM 23927 TaxID=1423727 RepID=A0A0R2AYZ0_9LACO|nr:DUF1129 family protein [Lacticaseibacillus brantae]KRM71762.1 membrane-associated protein [Lacticaseibacillus brantae DSM 23927]
MAETETTDNQPTVDVEALIGQLSKKNDDYIFKFRRELNDHAIPEAQQQTILAEMLPEMLAAQKQGKPATQLYGPVTVKVESILNAPKPVKKQPYWLVATDMSLFFLSLFALVYGVGAYFNPKSVTGAGGLVPMLLMALMAGFVFSYYNEWTRSPKDQRRPMWQILIGAMLIILLFSLLSSTVGQIKSPVTSAMSWIADAVLAAVAYGAHWLLKRQYGLRGVFSPQ